jgi:hypothetical protein
MTVLDFSPLDNKQMQILEFSKDITVPQLRQATHESIDYLLGLLADLDDNDVIFDPIDPLADDPFAKEGEEKIGWSLAHLVVHVTASSEEGANVSAILAQGIEFEGRLRYETPWETVKTVAHCRQRLEESRRMRLGALDMFPDEPRLDVFRKLSPRYVERFGEMNAPATFLFGLYHEVGHYAQFRDVRQQALNAKKIIA